MFLWSMCYAGGTPSTERHSCYVDELGPPTLEFDISPKQNWGSGAGLNLDVGSKLEFPQIGSQSKDISLK